MRSWHVVQEICKIKNEIVRVEDEIVTPIRSLNIESIIAWKVAGELHVPKNITVSYSNSPRLVLNAAFHSSPFLIWMLLYPHQTSSFVKYLAPLSLSMISDMRGSG